MCMSIEAARAEWQRAYLIVERCNFNRRVGRGSFADQEDGNRAGRRMKELEKAFPTLFDDEEAS